MGVRELTARYASDYMTVKFRKLRMEPEWLKSVFNYKVSFKLNYILFLFSCSEQTN